MTRAPRRRLPAAELRIVTPLIDCVMRYRYAQQQLTRQALLARRRLARYELAHTNREDPTHVQPRKHRKKP